MNPRDMEKMPAYYHIERDLTEMILKMRAGEKLPSESELIQQYSVSRTTVRTAMSNLERQNLITRKAGRGTFVRNDVAVQLLTSLKGFSAEMSLQRFVAESIVISHSLENPSKEVAAAFGISDNEQVMNLSRVRLKDGFPVAYECSYINISLGGSLKKLMSTNFNGTVSLYASLQELGFAPDHAIEEMKVDKLSRPFGNLLKCSVGQCILSRLRKSFLKDNRCIEYVQSVYRADKYVFRFFLKASWNSEDNES